MATSESTTDLKKLMLNLLESDLDSSSNIYHVGLSRSNDALDIQGLASSTLRQQLDVRHELQSLKTVSRASMVVPTIQWVGNRTYDMWDDNNASLTNFYVLNSQREVFVCIEQSKTDTGTVNVSTVEPTSDAAANQAKTFFLADGYKWRYLYKMTNQDFSNFKSFKYMPVKKITGSTTITEEVRSLALQDSAVEGEIIGIAIDSAGSGYTVEPAIVISGNGRDAVFSADVNNGSITRIRVESDGSGIFLHGTGYDFAQVRPSYGNASIRAIIAPKGGLSADARRTLFSDQLMFQLDFENTEGDTILAQNEFRTVGLFRNLTKYGSDSALTANTVQAMNSFTVSSPSGQLVEDEIITNQAGTATAYVYYHDLSGNTVYYFQNDSTGFGTFTTGQVIVGDADQCTIDAINNPAVDRYSGELLYINNIDAITRDTNQTEDLRIVLELD